MPYIYKFEGIFFIEGYIKEFEEIQIIKSDLSFKFGAQLKNINDVKKDLAKKAKNLGANAVLDFKYGQKARWLAIDDVAFFGSGKACKIDEEIIESKYLTKNIE